MAARDGKGLSYNEMLVAKALRMRKSWRTFFKKEIWYTRAEIRKILKDKLGVEIGKTSVALATLDLVKRGFVTNKLGTQNGRFDYPDMTYRLEPWVKL